MADVRRMAPEPTLAQVREYVLTMLEGLSSLAETVDDLQTRDRVRDFADHLMASWSPRSQLLLRREVDRLDQMAAAHAAERLDVPSAGRGDHPRGTVEETDQSAARGRAGAAAGSSPIVSKRRLGARQGRAPKG